MTDTDNHSHTPDPGRPDGPPLAWARSRAWWARVIDRVLRTGAQAALGAGVGTAATLGEVPWLTVASVAGVAMVASVLMALATPDRI